MRKLVTWTIAALAAGLGLRAVLRPGSRGRALLHRAGDRVGHLLRDRSAHSRALLRRRGDQASRRIRHQQGRWAGISYRLHGRRPDPGVDHNVLADRVRSCLGPLEKRLDLPHVHVMAEDHDVLLHGDVATIEQAEQIENAVLAISGVDGIDSYLHVGLLPSDTRPSAGARHHPPSDALRHLLDAATTAGVPDDQAQRTVRAVLATFVERLPEGERHQVTTHLPADVRQLTSPPRRLRIPAVPSRTVADLVAGAVSADPLAFDEAENVTMAVLATLRSLVPEEAADVADVLPEDLKQLWQTAPAI